MFIHWDKKKKSKLTDLRMNSYFCGNLLEGEALVYFKTSGKRNK